MGRGENSTALGVSHGAGARLFHPGGFSTAGVSALTEGGPSFLLVAQEEKPQLFPQITVPTPRPDSLPFVFSLLSSHPA